MITPKVSLAAAADLHKYIASVALETPSSSQAGGGTASGQSGGQKNDEEDDEEDDGEGSGVAMSCSDEDSGDDADGPNFAQRVCRAAKAPKASTKPATASPAPKGTKPAPSPVPKGNKPPSVKSGQAPATNPPSGQFTVRGRTNSKPPTRQSDPRGQGPAREVAEFDGRTQKLISYLEETIAEQGNKLLQCRLPSTGDLSLCCWPAELEAARRTEFMDSTKPILDVLRTVQADLTAAQRRASRCTNQEAVVDLVPALDQHVETCKCFIGFVTLLKRSAPCRDEYTTSLDELDSFGIPIEKYYKTLRFTCHCKENITLGRYNDFVSLFLRNSAAVTMMLTTTMMFYTLVIL